MGRYVAIVASIGFIIGLGVSVVLTKILPILPYQPDFQGYTFLGIRKPTIIGFLPYWLQGKAQEDYSNDITTLTYFGLALDTDGSIQKMVNAKEEEPGWTTLRNPAVVARLANAKKSGLKLSLLLQMSGEADIRTLVSNPTQNAETLVQDVAPVLKQYGFTDLNLDIESFSEASPAARTQFTQFVQTVADEMHRQKLGTVTIDVSPSTIVKPFIYDPIALGRIADTVVLMAYDYHYAGSYVAGPVAPVDGTGTVSEFDVRQGLMQAMRTIPREKLVLGIPLYGYEYETLSPVPGSPVVPGSGFSISYQNIVSVLSGCTNCTKTVDPISLEPSITFPAPDAGITKQIFYEDQASVQQKIALAQNNQLGGVAMWALGYENQDLLAPITSYKQSFWFAPALSTTH